MKTKVFVYGSLLPGLGNHGVIASSETLGAATTEPIYTMVSLGAFPAIVEGGETAIHGEVYEVDSDTLAALDRLEGHPRFYKRMLIWLAGGESSAYTYLLPPERIADRHLLEVPSGNWYEHLREQGELPW